MSSIATFFRTLPETLQQPAALAMLGSVGAHLIVFATLPAFTSSTEPRPEAEVRRVRLLEPPQGTPNSQIARSQLGLPPVPNSPNSRIQLPITEGGNSPLPNPLYTIPDLNPVPVPNPPPPQLSAQDRIALQQKIIEYNRRITERQRQLEQQQAQANQPPKPPEPKPQQQITTTSVPGLNQANPADVARTITPPPPANTPNQSTPTTPPVPTSPPIDRTQIERNNQLLAANRFNSEGTTQQEGLQVLQTLAQQLEPQKVNLAYVQLRQPGEKPKEIDYPLSYTPSDFKQHPPRPLSIAVFVGKDGKLLADRKPVVLVSSGYQILNDKAIEYVLNDASKPDRFEAINEDKIRVVVYDLQFKAPNTQPVS